MYVFSLCFFLLPELVTHLSIHSVLNIPFDPSFCSRECEADESDLMTYLMLMRILVPIVRAAYIIILEYLHYYHPSAIMFNC